MPKRRHRRKSPEDEEASDVDEAPDPKSRDFYFDEVDEFETQKDKILLEKGIPPLDSDEEESDEDGVMDLNLSEDEEDDDDDEDFDMDSDLEDKEKDGLPSDRAWGKKKGMYYNTDYEDKDYMGFGGSDGEAAEAEEKEALAIQKRMAQTLKDSDFGLSDFQVGKKIEIEAPKKITKNLSAMSKREKTQLLQKESPEFLGIVEDFKSKISDLMTIKPLLSLVQDGRIPNGAGATYLQTKYHLLLTYLTNISFYMILKARHVPIENHPVIKRILEFRMLLQQLESVDDNLKPEINELLQMIEDGEDIPMPEQPKTVASRKTKNHEFKKAKLQQKIKQELQNANAGIKEPTMKKKSVTFSMDKKTNNETEDEKRALELYEMMKDLKKGKHVEDDPGESSADNTEEYETKAAELLDNQSNSENDELEDAAEELGEQSDKRGVTYQIAKNKGIMPHRKKEQRNPRVKHRTKFKKAKIRRKGQVREPRLELSKYSGEVSGIRAGVRHSVKIK